MAAEVATGVDGGVEEDDDMGVAQGRVAVVSAGVGGIGRAIAEMLLTEGASVVINGRDPERGAKVVEEMGGSERLRFVVGDMTRQGDCEALVASAVDAFGSIDILVNNAGGGGKTDVVVDMSDDMWSASIEFNLNNPFWCTRAALKHMIPNGWGRIVNMSSIYGKIPLPGVAGYVTTKHALVGLTKAVAQEVGAHGITCNAVSPGVVLTEVWERNGPGSAAAIGLSYEDYLDQILAGSVIGRANTVSEVAAVVRLLCSEAGAGITGANYSVDGGTTPY